MSKMSRRIFGAIALGLLVTTGKPTLAAPPNNTTKEAKQAVAKGIAYLKSVQETDGSWGKYPGTTALALCALLRNGQTELKTPAVAKGVKYLLQAVKPDGGIYSEADPQLALPNYNTSLSLMALALTRNVGYIPVIKKAQKFLEGLQDDEENGTARTDPRYGGMGYGTQPDRPDLSNLQLALEALKDSGESTSAPVWKKAIVFLQRVQNRKESNDQAWAKEGTNDGGFIYNVIPRNVAPDTNGHPTSYGAMTYAGLKSYLYAGVTKDDPRAKAAWDWIRGNYTVKEHPGMGDNSLYYYYHTMSKTLDVYGQKIFTDKNGKKHEWSRELATQLVSLQHPDGSWFNVNSRFWEDRPALVTSYTLIALSYCLKQ